MSNWTPQDAWSHTCAFVLGFLAGSVVSLLGVLLQ